MHYSANLVIFYELSKHSSSLCRVAYAGRVEEAHALFGGFKKPNYSGTTKVVSSLYCYACEPMEEPQLAKGSAGVG